MDEKLDLHGNPAPMFRRYSNAALTAIALVSLISFAFFELSISGSINDSRIINRSGRQRMLSQMLVKDALLLASRDRLSGAEIFDEFRRNLLEWEAWQEALRERDPARGLNGSSSAEVVAAFTAIQGVYGELRDSLHRIADFDETQGSWNRSKSSILASVLSVEKVYVSGMDSITSLFESESRTRIFYFQILMISAFTLILVLLAIIYGKVFHPFERRLSSYFNQLDNALVVLGDQAATDPLTGLYNKRSGLLFLESDFQKARRAATDLSLVFLDLDNLKIANDAYGHEEGDRLIKAFAGLLSQAIRSRDHVFRYGGDEFVLILEGAPQSAANAIDRIERGVGLAEQNGGLLSRISFSWGASALSEIPGADASTLLRSADERMYTYKKLKKAKAD